MKLLYITFVDTGDIPTSGSSVRACKMLEAFKTLGCDVMLLDGWNSRAGLASRKIAVDAMRARIATERPDVCYVELPVGPIFYRGDAALLREIHGLGIPLYLFYGDAYWRFPEFDVFGTKRSFAQTIKDKLVRWMEKRDWKLYADVADVIYFPSASMADYFDFPKKRVSFPGSSNRGTVSTATDGESVTGLFVGGATYRYGATLLLDSFAAAFQADNRMKLIFICSQDAWMSLPEQYRSYETSEWLTHLSAYGDEQLAPYYSRADFACLPLRRNIYNDFAVSIKLFEYLAYRKPVIATDCPEQAKIVQDMQTGFVSEDTVQAFSETLLKFARLSFEEREVFIHNAERALPENTWQHRAQEILDDFKSDALFIMENDR